jgi:hypothetical protein
MTDTVTDAAITALGRIIDRWPDLTDALTVRQTTGWPPVMGIAVLTRDAEARDQALTDRAAERSPDQLGTRPVPISLDILDVMTDIERALVDFVDVVASTIQRPPMSGPPTNSGWTAADHVRRRQLAAEDAADVRRWRYNGQRSATYAAAWLQARLAGPDGPFTPLTATDITHIGRVATAAVDRIEQALREARQTRTLDRPCPHCRADRLEIHGGDGRDPAIQCSDCGWTKTTSAAA